MRAIIYARVSSVTDRQNTDRQVCDLNNYAAANNMDVVQVFTEHVSGAAKNADRPVLMQAIEFARNNTIDIILLSEMSRLGRSVYELQSIVKELIDSHINAFFLKEKIELLNADGKPSMMTPILISVLGVCAAIERENIAYRLASGRKQAIAKGVRMGRKVGSTMSIADKEEKYAEILKKIRKGDKLTDILAWAKGKGYKISYATLKNLKRDLC